MALSMLVGGADCGPSNPLQGLSKRFDQDRGAQKDLFGPGRAGSSRETFRSQTLPAGSDEDAARFFSQTMSPIPQLAPEAAYDLSALHAGLPQQLAPGPSQLAQPVASANWAMDFAGQQTLISPQVASSSNAQVSLPMAGTMTPVHMQSVDGLLPQGNMQWNRSFSAYGMGNLANMPSLPLHAPQQPVIQSSQISWDKAFSSQEMRIATPSSQVVEENQTTRSAPPVDQDELARTAGMLLENIKDEQNPKFKNSQFLNLMQKLRDRDVIVEGNEMVKNEGQATKVDVKGKGKAIDVPVTSPMTFEDPSARLGLHTNFANTARQEIHAQAQDVDPNLAYFEQENADYAAYWENVASGPSQSRVHFDDSQSWGRLQEDWEQFETTASGIKAVNHYQFQVNNPFLLVDARNTHNHLMHGGGHLSLSESVLQLEAAVQQNMNDASAWFELGVKQQENEREAKALQALQRAVELDSSHLPSWLALAISHTNEGNRSGTHDTIRQWVNRNDRYRSVSAQYPETSTGTMTERYGQLIDCLISMARSDTSGAIDADIQIALAVLLNSDEDYEKAQDCFRTALAVRPEDWLLYNRVGATMANSGQAEGALEYYYKALELNPGYIRARFNLGISCINLRRYEEAAQHIFDALMLQDNDGVKESGGLNDKRGVTSKALWDSLKTACMQMQRIDLATTCDRQDLEAFKNIFLA